ncbi:hypothetical protein [Methylovulum psychrotolerans]|uniref:Uncharacterized protein n=1 Tax=Methylovulum psychrotolerans TaxID=1704499 RepID=A0A2S5CI97_9GAMM|nr:hypothetical protein [Methylovulum psychrotolerans]POZ50487.1 hypothetical protein AADEFJLK_03683 [Methylovulum psychrotolerans]
MVKNSSEPDPIANTWHSLPFPQQNHLISLLSGLVQRQLMKTIQAKGGGNEHTLTQSEEKSIGYKREDQISPHQSKSSNIYPPIYPTTSSPSSGVDPAAIRPC